MRRITGVSDMCDYPKEAVERPKLSRSRIDCAVLSSEEVEAKVQELKAAGTAPFTVDVQALAREPPGLLLTQDACAACDVDKGAVQQVPLENPWTNGVCLLCRLLTSVCDKSDKSNCIISVYKICRSEAVACGAVLDSRYPSIFTCLCI